MNFDAYTREDLIALVLLYKARAEGYSPGYVTDRRWRVWSLLNDGKSCVDIAKMEGLSITTIKNDLIKIAAMKYPGIDFRRNTIGMLLERLGVVRTHTKRKARTDTHERV